MKGEEMERYDSRPDTYAHISTVRGYLNAFIHDLLDRAHLHDHTKLREPELSAFDEFTPKLRDSTYGSDEYASYLDSMRDAVEHHYRAHRHHPEHFRNGVQDMTLVDVLEMLCDWKAATERHADGDLAKSIEMNADRFGYGDEFKRLLVNTARSVGWVQP